MPPRRNIRNRTQPTPISQWTQNADCVGQEDPVDRIPIPDGHGFRLEVDNHCYHGNSIARIHRMGRALLRSQNKNSFYQ